MNPAPKNRAVIFGVTGQAKLSPELGKNNSHITNEDARMTWIRPVCLIVFGLVTMSEFSS
jgi:hypothetical protein